MSIDHQELEQMNDMFREALGHAAKSLGCMINRDVVIQEVQLHPIDSGEVPNILGGSQKIVSGIYMQYRAEGLEVENINFNGHLLLTFNIESAYEIASILTKDLSVPLDRISGMTDSIFGEIGNVFGTGILTYLANQANCKLLPTIPTVINYKADSIIDYVKSRMIVTEHPILLIETSICTDNHVIAGKFFLLPEDYRSIRYLFNKTLEQQT